MKREKKSLQENTLHKIFQMRHCFSRCFPDRKFVFFRFGKTWLHAHTRQHSVFLYQLCILWTKKLLNKKLPSLYAVAIYKYFPSYNKISLNVSIWFKNKTCAAMHALRAYLNVLIVYSFARPFNLDVFSFQCS